MKSKAAACNLKFCILLSLDFLFIAASRSAENLKITMLTPSVHFTLARGGEKLSLSTLLGDQ